MTNFGIKLTRFALNHPKGIARGMLLITVLLVAGAGLPTLFPKALGFLPQVTIDTDPENMLPADDPARVLHNEYKERFSLHDAVVVGVVNEKHKDGVFTPETLSNVFALTEFALDIEGVIAADVMAPSTADSIQSDGPGSVTFDWLMPKPPTTKEEALAVRDRAMRIPFLRNTLVSEDGKALVIYLPIEDKDLAHEVATALRKKIAQFPKSADQFHIAGLPVAEDTFGIEMFIQMAISAPAAMLVIFLLMWFFFRNLIIIVSPMLVAMAAAFTTMALLVITGNTVHIMSSMIPIFIMPIAVLDAVHIISDFFDTYQKTGDRRKTIETVMGHLSAPMLFTSLTTSAGFLSLAFTPIPPVQVFGIFVAIGVFSAWLFTILFVPAYIMLLSPKRLQNFGRDIKRHESHGGILALLGRMRTGHAKLIVVGALALAAVAYVGIVRIHVNDNPTKWFEETHEIRIADKVLNSHFGGTYDAYFSLQYKAPIYSPSAFAEQLRRESQQEVSALDSVFTKLGSLAAAPTKTDILDHIDELDAFARKMRTSDTSLERRVAWSLAGDLLAEQFDIADEASEQEPVGEATPVQVLSEAIQERSKALLAAHSKLRDAAVTTQGATPSNAAAFREHLHRALEDTSSLTQKTLDGFLARNEQAHQVFKRPEVLAFVEGLQTALAAHPAVGKSNSLADIVKVVHRDLRSGDDKDYRLPDTREVVGQTLSQYQSSHRKDDLWHFVTSDYQHAIIWFQLRSGDNVDMEAVVAEVESYLSLHAAPIELEEPAWFGLTYINVVWQENMVTGMVGALLGSFVIVLLMMTFLFRSMLWGILSMIPLTLTVALIYGILGLVGKDYDMPVAVLSSLSLGLAVDYAIHFLARARELRNTNGSWSKAQPLVFQEPARAIARNVVVVGMGFLPLLLAPLVPYQTVGILIAAILLAAGIATLIILPALIRLLEPLLFRQTKLPPVRVSQDDQ